MGMKGISALGRALLLTLALCLSISQPALAQQAPELLEPVSVQLDTFAARVDEICKITMYDAAVIPYLEELSFPQEGTLSEVHVIIGQEVKKGDVLLTLNQDAEIKQLEGLKKDIEALETSAYYAEQLIAIDLAMLEVELRALESQLPPDEEAMALKKLEMEEMQLNAELEAAIRDLKLTELRGKLEEMEAKLSQSTLCAPFDGRVIHMAELSRGAYVGAYAPLIFLADDSRLSLRSAFIAGSSLSDAHAIYAIIGDGRYTVTPVEMDPREYVALMLAGEEPTTDFIIEQPDSALAPGMYAAVCVERLHVADALLVPSNAVYSGDGERYLYVIEDGLRVRRDVKTGVSNESMTQITEGLEEGEIVYVKE